jgi:hypothetical protein
MGIFGFHRVKTKRCKNRECKQRFIPARPYQEVCDTPECAEAYAAQKRETANKAAWKKLSAEIKARKEQLKTRRDWINEAQTAFNAYVRERDKSQGCICCGAVLRTGGVGGAFDCGHYRSVGSAPHLRFNEANAHGQTKQCNRYGGGRAVDYRIGLIARIGLEAVESLEADQTPRKWSIDQLKAIRDLYRGKLKELKKISPPGEFTEG